MAIVLSEAEIEYIKTSPDLLRGLKEYHDLQLTQGEPMGFNCSFHHKRIEALEAEAQRLEQLYEQG